MRVSYHAYPTLTSRQTEGPLFFADNVRKKLMVPHYEESLKLRQNSISFLQVNFNFKFFVL